MRSRVLAFFALAGLALGGPVQGDHGCNGTVIQLDAGSETFYIDDRSTLEHPLDRWLYLESNGIPGLQSGGAVVVSHESIVPSILDPCVHDRPDKLFFVGSG